MLNREISFQEVSEAVNKLKEGKAYLQIPNEILKDLSSKNLLHRLFSICFSSGLNPSEWSLSDIKPIPKPDKDQRDPLQNRCISIMCCVAKLYSGILTSRLQSRKEQNYS